MKAKAASRNEREKAKSAAIKAANGGTKTASCGPMDSKQPKARKPKQIHTGCRTPLLRAQVEELVRKFVQGDSLLFVDFKRVWKDKKFSLIHHNTEDATMTSRLTDALQHIFAEILLVLGQRPDNNSSGSVVTDDMLKWSAGLIYALFCTFQTQLFTPREPIRVCLGSWKKLLVEHSRLAAHASTWAHEAHAALALLERQNGAFAP